MKIKVIVQDEDTKSNIEIKDQDYTTTIKRIEKYLKAFFDYTFSGAENEFVPQFVPEWIGEYDVHNLSQKEKVNILLEREHQGDWVRSQEIKEEYERVYGGEIKLSSVSTYLSRFYGNGDMERRGSRAQREYKLFDGIII